MQGVLYKCGWSVGDGEVIKAEFCYTIRQQLATNSTKIAFLT